MSHEGNPFAIEPAPSTLRSAQLPVSEMRSIVPSPSSNTREAAFTSEPRSVEAWDLMVDPEDVPPETLRTGAPAQPQVDAQARRRYAAGPVAEAMERDLLNMTLKAMYGIEQYLKHADYYGAGALKEPVFFQYLEQALECTAQSHQPQMRVLDEILRPLRNKIQQKKLSHSDVHITFRRVVAWLDERQAAEHRAHIESGTTSHSAA